MDIRWNDIMKRRRLAMNRRCDGNSCRCFQGKDLKKTASKLSDNGIGEGS